MHSISCLLLMRRRCAAIAIATVLGGCAAGTAAPPAALPMPSAYVEAAAADGVVPAVAWWRRFDCAELSSLIEAALAGGFDLQIAAERVRQAEAQANIAGASLFPALGLGAGATRREARGQRDAGAADGASATSATSVTLSASYQVDVWGQNRSAASSAEFSLRATRYQRDTLRLTVAGGVASAYFQLLSVRERLALAHDNITLAQRVLQVVDVRARNGAASALDVARQRSALLGQQAALAPLQLQERQLLDALALLLGQPAQGFTVAGVTPAPLAIPAVAPGLPASLLTRRPDLAAIEAQLAAAHADIAVARAALLPAITLTASAGAASTALSELVSAPALAFSVGAALAQAIFDGGRLRAQLDSAASRERELLFTYRKAIVGALGEVENALAAAGRLGERAALLEQALQQAERALRLAQVRYREGADDLIVLLDAQRTLFLAREQLAQNRQARLQATLDLFNALGGGWTPS